MPPHRPSSRPSHAFADNGPGPYPYVHFQLVGETGLTAVGNATGNRYCFDRQGVVIAVDARDLRSLAAINVLRQVG